MTAPDDRRALIELTPELMRRLRDPRVVVGWILIAAGAIALFVGYWGVSGTLDPGKQLPYVVSGGLGGLFLLGLGVALVLHAELGETRRQVLDLRALIENRPTAPLEEMGRESHGPFPRDSENGALAALPRASSFHRADCAVLAGKAGVQAVSASDVNRRGLTPCRLCAP
jgi:hypothetical protein